MAITILVYTLLTLPAVLYLYIKWCHSYWKTRNIVYLEPSPIYGNIKKVIYYEEPFTALLGEIYNKVKAEGKKFGGMYALLSPQFIPVDLDLIKKILQVDFEYFVNHGGYINEKEDPLTGNIYNLEDDKWWHLRVKLTPSFSPSKIKMIFQTLVDCTQNLHKVLEKCAVGEEPVDIKDVSARFTTDVMGSVVFGLDIHSLEDPNSKFRMVSKQFWDPSRTNTLISFILTLLPEWIYKTFIVSAFEKDIEAFFMNLVKDTVKYREKHNIYRKDFMHLLIRLKNIGLVGGDDDYIIFQENIINSNKLTINQIAAQAFLFFLAGYETTSTSISFTLLELALNQDIQNKLREEIVMVLKNHNNAVTYESIEKMEYLEKVYMESLRKHAPVGTLSRVCTKRYQIPDSNIVLEKGFKLTIPVLAIHRDPDHYPDPDKFDPERFSDKNKASRHPFAFLPFGQGPRECIGMRFAKIESKVALSCILKNYKITLNEKTQLPIKYDVSFVFSSVKGGVWLNLEKLS